MTKDKLENLANELANCTKALLRIVEALENGMESRLEETEKVIPERKALSFEEVRKAAADKSRQGFTAEVKALIEKYGAEKLSSVKPEDYEAFMKELEGISHAG
nr:MAG TPA_asm: hypothetical protein [Caudoviricetes sp.]